MPSKNKKVKNATPVVYNDIKFKSKLEVYCYKRLEEEGIPVDYEPNRYLIFEPFIFNNESHEVKKHDNRREFVSVSNKIRGIYYTPDFVDRNNNFIIETKGNPNDAWPLRLKLFKRFLVINNMNYELFVPRNKKQVDETIRIIKEKYYNEGK